MRRFLPLFAALSLSACATVGHQQRSLSEQLVGQPQAALVARYGYPLVTTKDKVMLWPASSVRAVSVPHVTSFVGTFGATPVSGTAVSYDSYPSIVGCTLRAWIDSSGVVTRVTLEGDSRACKAFSGA